MVHSASSFLYNSPIHLSFFSVYLLLVGDLDLETGAFLPSLVTLKFDIAICEGAIVSCNLRDLESIFVLDFDLFRSRNRPKYR